jgi:hypothetical protein
VSLLAAEVLGHRIFNSMRRPRSVLTMPRHIEGVARVPFGVKELAFDSL